MLNVKTNKLVEDDLKLAIMDINGEKKEEKLNLLRKIADSAKWDIGLILSRLDHTELQSKKLRNDFRKVLIAKKYGIHEKWYDNDFNTYYVGRATDDCIIIQCEDSRTSIILSPQGELIVDEGIVRLNENSLAPNGYNAKSSQGQGLYSRKGKEILPCIFDEVNNKIDGSLYVIYKNVQFTCRVKEESDNASSIMRKIPCFAFDGGIVQFQFPRLLTDGYHVTSGIYGAIKNTREHSDYDELSRKKDEVSKEVFMKLSSTHHRLTDDEIEMLK